MITFLLNNQLINTHEPPGSTVLDFVRYHKHLVGTKIGCREGDCGACSILVGEIVNQQLRYRSMTSCLMPLNNAQGKHIVTIEGLNLEQLSPVQQAIIDEGGTQCGFCTVGFVVSLTGFALSQKQQNYQEAIAAIDGNICRCTGYKSLERAAAQIVQQLKDKDQKQSLSWLVKHSFLPDYFLNIPNRLAAIETTKINDQISQNQIVGGGTDLFVQRPEEMAETNIQSLFNHPDFKKIYQKEAYCYIGAAATAEDIQSSPLIQSIFPNILGHMKLVSSTPIRNMGTVAGNLINASPIGDLTIFFLALDSQIVLNHNGSKRNLPLKALYKGYKQLDKAQEEYIEAIYFKIPASADYFNFEKVCKRTHLDIATVNAACLLKMEGKIIKEAHLSAGGVGPIPFYLKRSSAALIGQEVSKELLQKVAAIIQEEISPISDARGSSDYKRLLLRQLFFAHFLTFFPELLALEILVSSPSI